jgi:epoxyqueuosine reductase QueG
MDTQTKEINTNIKPLTIDDFTFKTKVQNATTEKIRKIAIEEGADDIGFVNLDRPALQNDKEKLKTVYSKAKTAISLVKKMNRENIQSPARYSANVEFHHTIDDLTDIARRILRRLNDLNIRGVVPTVGFPMDMDALGKDALWHVSHKPIAVEAGLGQMGKNRNVIHQKFGNFILLETILIDTELDRYDYPIAYNPCVTCNLCVTACPVGAIQRDGDFNFMACMDHNYREFMGGFQEWSETLVSSKNIEQYRENFQDNETASMWQSLSFGANYKAAYCMAVCPAGEEVIPPFIENSKVFVNDILRPLKEKEESVYVRKGSRAERFASKNPAKEIRHIKSPYRPQNIDFFLKGATLQFNPEKAKDLDLVIQFRFYGEETLDAFVQISNQKIKAERGEHKQSHIEVSVDSKTWLKIVNKETTVIWSILTRKMKTKGNPLLLKRFENCLDS